MDEISERLDNIITTAQNIKSLIFENWYDLFFNREDSAINFMAFNEETEEAYKLLGNIQDLIYQIICEDDD